MVDEERGEDAELLPSDETRESTRPALVADLLAEIEALAEATRLQAKSLEVLSSLVAERRRVWMVMAGGRRGTLVAGPFGSPLDAEYAREVLMGAVIGDDTWGPIHPDEQSAAALYTVIEYLVTYPLGWSGE